eukprot:5834633-Pyramimonas_sp.AAC.1
MRWHRPQRRTRLCQPRPGRAGCRPTRSAQARRLHLLRQEWEARRARARHPRGAAPPRRRWARQFPEASRPQGPGVGP